MRKYSTILLTILLSSCSGTQKTGLTQLRVEDKPIIDCTRDYIVRGNDTLARIAQICGFSLVKLAKANQIDPPYRLYPRQKIRFYYEGETSLREQVVLSEMTSDRPSEPFSAEEIINRPPKKVAPQQKWASPVDARIKQNFSRKKRHLGITYQTKPRQSVYAIAGGTVVYSSDKMLSHGKIVIIKHKNNFYSSYTQNQKILVKNGDKVYIGEVIAITGKQSFRLEMRYRSKAINPNQYIR